MGFKGCTCNNCKQGHLKCFYVKSTQEDLIAVLCKFIIPISLYVLITPSSGGQAVWPTYFFFFEQSTLCTYFTFKVLIYISFYEMRIISPFTSLLNVQ